MPLGQQGLKVLALARGKCGQLPGQGQGLSRDWLSFRKWASGSAQHSVSGLGFGGLSLLGVAWALSESVGTGAQRQKEDAWVANLSPGGGGRRGLPPSNGLLEFFRCIIQQKDVGERLSGLSPG